MNFHRRVTLPAMLSKEKKIDLRAGGVSKIGGFRAGTGTAPTRLRFGAGSHNYTVFRALEE